MSEETPRQALALMFRDAVRGIALESGDNRGTPTNLYIRSPLFGHCRLLEHSADERPDGAVFGYVEIEGESGDFPLAMWITDKWLNRNGKPFNKPIVRWFGLEQLDA